MGGIRLITLTPTLSLRADRGRHFANRHSGVGRNPEAGASFDKLRTNDSLVCLPLSTLRERGLLKKEKTPTEPAEVSARFDA